MKTSKLKVATREEWLLIAVSELRPLLTAAGYDAPSKLHVSVGWPSRSALSAKQRLGECWYGETSADGCCQLCPHGSKMSLDV